MDTPYTDLLALVEQDGFQSVDYANSRGGQYNGPCPWCHGDNRFRVQPHHGPHGWFICSQCGKCGSAIDYLMMRRGLTHHEALLAVNWKPKDGSLPHLNIPAQALASRSRWDSPPERWQQRARDVARECQDRLWSRDAHPALDYLHSRGFKDETLRYAMLGYNDHGRKEPASLWGMPQDVSLFPGIVIPWLHQGDIWRVTIRDERVESGQPGRYKQVAGGSNGLYLADSLALGRETVVLTEGEFDALSVAQVCGRVVSVVATGSTQGGHTSRWLSLLAQPIRVLIAFDSEEKAENAASWWLKRLPNAQRFRPWWKDANQMLQDGADLSQWIKQSQREQASHQDEKNALAQTFGKQLHPLQDVTDASNRSQPGPVIVRPPVEKPDRAFPFPKERQYVRTRVGTVGYLTPNSSPGRCFALRGLLDDEASERFTREVSMITWEQARDWWILHTTFPCLV